MLIKRNGFLMIITFILLLSIVANIYSFNKMEKNNEEYIENISKLKEENKQNNEQEDINKNNDSKEESKDNSKENKESENNKINEDDKIKEDDNTIKRFIEYTFNTNEEDYSTRKKNAKEYMTDELFNKYFSSDSIDSDEMKILVEVKEVEVFHGYDNDNAIVRYVIKESKAQGDYEDEIEKYANIKLSDGKVSNIKSLSNNEWGI